MQDAAPTDPPATDPPATDPPTGTAQPAADTAPGEREVLRATQRVTVTPIVPRSPPPLPPEAEDAPKGHPS